MNREQQSTNIGQNLEAQGWRQGSVIKNEDFYSILDKCTPDFKIIKNFVAVLISQSCDIANNKLNDGPFIEIMIGEYIAKINEDYAFNKHPRILHVTLNKKTGDINVSADVFVEFKGYQTIRATS